MQRRWSLLCAKMGCPNPPKAYFELDLKFVSPSTLSQASEKKLAAMIRQGPRGAIVEFDSHLSVTGRYMSLADKFRGGQRVAEAIVSSLREGGMPKSSKIPNQA